VYKQGTRLPRPGLEDSISKRVKPRLHQGRIRPRQGHCLEI